MTGARVREISVGPTGLATGAVYVDRDGNEQRVAADVVVVAANGIGTRTAPPPLGVEPLPRRARELVRARGQAPDAPPVHERARIYEEELESWLGPGGTPLLSLQFADTDPARGFARGAQWDVLSTWGSSRSCALRRPAVRGAVGPALHERVKRTIGHAFDWGIGIEDLPVETNTVTLDAELTDGDGIPAPRVCTASTTIAGEPETGSWSGRARRTRRPAPARRWSPTGRSGAGTCSGRPAWATIRRPRWSTAGAGRTTCRTST